MSIVSISQSPGRPPRHRWTGSEFDRAAASGIFDGQRVELIDGDILEMSPMNDPHAQAIQLMTYALMDVFPPTRAIVRVQCPMRLGESRPFPDFAVVEGTPRTVVSHPTSALLVIEVSDTTLDFDRNEKATLYATHALAEYWIVNLNGRCIEVRRNPIGKDVGDPRYGELRVYQATDRVTPLAAPGAALLVSELLPTVGAP